MPRHALISIQRIRVRQKRRPRLACPKEHVEVAAHKPSACDPECHGIAATIVNARQRLAAEVGLASDVAALYRDHPLKAEITPGRAMTVFWAGRPPPFAGTTVPDISLAMSYMSYMSNDQEKSCCPFAFAPDIEARLEFLARETGRTKSHYAREAILEKIEDMEDAYFCDKTLERIRQGTEVVLTAEDMWCDLDD